ncbi:ABC transporter permease [Flavitalea flava]
MFKNNLRIAYRNLLKYKGFSVINITGLALGMTCSLLILLWVLDERSVDNFHAHGDRLYLVVQKVFTDNKVNAGYFSPGPLAPELKRMIPEIEYASGIAEAGDKTFELEGKILRQKGCYADSDYFKLFDFPLLQGNAETALQSPLSLAISDKMATTFFGSAATAIGKTIHYENKKALTITAVFADLPDNTAQKFDFLVNWATFHRENGWSTDWRNNGPHTPIMLKDGADPQKVRAKLKHFLDTYNKEQTANFRIELDMQRFGDSWLYSNFKNGLPTGGRIEYVRLFSAVAIFILLIACINFMNLATARSSRRSKEIGVRKVAGAGRWSLVRQFMTEAVFLTTLSVLLSLVLVSLLLPSFNHLTGKQIAPPFSSSVFWLILTALTLITGLVAGSYPALFLASFKPIRVLKGTLRFGQGTVLIRKGLVVFQFVLSIVLISSTVIVSRQIAYLQEKNLGYNRANLLYIPMQGALSRNYSLFKQQASDIPGIAGISRITETPTDINFNTAGLDWQGKDPNSSPMFIVAAVGYDFVKTMSLTLLEGRDFSKTFASDSTGYLVNETAVNILGYKNPIGMPLTLWGKKGTITGVMKDFHFNSLHEQIQPLVLAPGEHINDGTILVRTEAGNTGKALAGLEKISKDLNPKFSFTYSFSDDEYQKLYKNEQIVATLSDSFAILAISISCLGLLGLALFTSEQRAKEIGIRKLLGASVSSLFSLLSREFIVLVLLSLAIATPLAWWAMYTWLQDFAYRITISWWMFGLAGLMAIFIALFTVGFQALKAAVANPVKTLRTE